MRFIIVLLASIFLFCACRKSEADDLVGTYEVLTIENKSCTDSEDNLKWDLENGLCLDNEGDEFECGSTTGTWTFDKEGEFQTSMTLSIAGFSQTETDEGVYVVTDKNNIEMCDLEDECLIGTFEIDNNILDIESKDQENGCTVIVKLKRQ